MAWRGALVVGWVLALAGLVALSETIYVVGGLVLTVAVGALLARWPWVVAPIVVTVLIVGGIFLLIGGCDDDCGGDDGFWAIVWWFLIVFTAPATLAMAIGVGARRVLRRSPPPAQPVP